MNLEPPSNGCMEFAFACRNADGSDLVSYRGRFVRLHSQAHSGPVAVQVAVYLALEEFQRMGASLFRSLRRFTRNPLPQGRGHQPTGQ